MNKQELIISLKSLSQELRKNNPVPHRESLSAEEEWECKIVGGDFIAWSQQYLHDILDERIALKAMDFDPEPLIIFTTSTFGLVALKEIMPRPLEHFVFLLHEDYEKWLDQNKPDSKTYIQHWSYVQGLNDEQLSDAKKLFPETSEKDFRIHSRGDLWGENCGAFGEHLWHWDGEKMEVLKENFIQGVY